MDASLWLAEILLFKHTSLTQNGEAPKEIQTVWLQQDVSEWLVCVHMSCYSYYLVADG